MILNSESVMVLTRRDPGASFIKTQGQKTQAGSNNWQTGV